MTIQTDSVEVDAIIADLQAIVASLVEQNILKTGKIAVLQAQLNAKDKTP